MFYVTIYLGDNMDISRNLAHQIVNNIKGIIHQDLNFMDRQGMIIASTNPNRVNTFHEAAKACVDRKRIIVIEYDNQYRGSKKGINIPVEFENDIIGVIGITGNRSEVEQYGTIIKKMTEILLKEEWIKENETQKRDNYRNLLEGIIYDRFKDVNLMYSIDENSLKHIAVSKPFTSYLNTELVDKVLNILDSYFHNNNKVLYSFVYQELVILFMDNSKISLERILKAIVQSTNEILKLEIAFGVSSPFSDLNSTNTYFNQALSSHDWQRKYEKKEDSILFYEDMDLGILLTDISTKNRINFSNKVLKNLSEEEIEFYHNLLNIYGNNNGSIKSISEELFMHKNTIQYRLNRLFDLTGYNPREYNGYTILKLAFLLRDDSKTLSL